MDFQQVGEIDRYLLGVVNGAHSLFFDSLMMTLTSGLTWIPLYIALLYLVIKNNDTMTQIFLAIGCCLLCLFITEFVTEGLVKPAVGRLRPGSDPRWMYDWHVVDNLRGRDFSFFSAHAANTMGITMFFCLLVRSRILSWMMVIWSLVNCYTRLYLAMHYPSDILVGLAFGALAGMVAYLVYYLIFRQVSAKQNYISSQYTSTGYSRADVDVVATALVASYVLAIIWSLVQQ